MAADDFDEANAAVIAELLADPVTSENIRLQLINEILQSDKGKSFWDTMLKEDMSLSSCPNCGHHNHWLIPEDDLNEMGWVTSEKDKKVPKNTDIKSCPQWQESCSKKKVSV